jgi:predicted GIY-YIG superfamily endonuclease
MKNYIYHIRYKEDNNNIDKGYIGLTNNIARRRSTHWSALLSNVHKNHKLQKAFNERPEDIEFKIYKEFVNRKEAALLEETIRPLSNIGWNIAVGGERDYTERFERKHFNIENEFIDDRLFQERFSFKNNKFSILKKIMRNLFKNTINKFIASKQVVILNNIFLKSNFLPHKSSISLIMDAWGEKEDIFFGNWDAIPNDIIAVGFALSLQIKDENLDFDSRNQYFIPLSKIIEQFFINSELLKLNQVDAILVDIILVNYVTFTNEFFNKHSAINDELSKIL